MVMYELEYIVLNQRYWPENNELVTEGEECVITEEYKEDINSFLDLPQRWCAFFISPNKFRILLCNSYDTLKMLLRQIRSSA